MATERKNPRLATQRSAQVSPFLWVSVKLGLVPPPLGTVKTQRGHINGIAWKARKSFINVSFCYKDWTRRQREWMVHAPFPSFLTIVALHRRRWFTSTYWATKGNASDAVLLTASIYFWINRYCSAHCLLKIIWARCRCWLLESIPSEGWKSLEACAPALLTSSPFPSTSCTLGKPSTHPLPRCLGFLPSGSHLGQQPQGVQILTSRVIAFCSQRRYSLRTFSSTGFFKNLNFGFYL